MLLVFAVEITELVETALADISPRKVATLALMLVLITEFAAAALDVILPSVYNLRFVLAVDITEFVDTALAVTTLSVYALALSVFPDDPPELAVSNAACAVVYAIFALSNAAGTTVVERVSPMTIVLFDPIPRNVI